MTFIQSDPFTQTKRFYEESLRDVVTLENMTISQLVLKAEQGCTGPKYNLGQETLNSL